MPWTQVSASFSLILWGERGGSVVECRTPEREVRGSRPTAAMLCPWARHFTPRKYWLITQEAMAPSRHDWKIVDWDVKPQHNQLILCSALILNYSKGMVLQLCFREHFLCKILTPFARSFRGGMTKCMHHTAPGKIQYHNDGKSRSLPTIFVPIQA